MEVEFRRPKTLEDAMSALNAAIKALNPAENASSITPVKAAITSVDALLMIIEESMVDELDCVMLGLFCADICQALGQGTNGKKQDELSQTMCDAIKLLTMRVETVADIRGKLTKWGKRNVASRYLHARKDKVTIATWKSDLDKILQVFNKELVTNVNAAVSATCDGVTNTHTVVSDVPNDPADPGNILSDIHHNTLRSPEDMHGQGRMSHASAPGRSPTPLSRRALGTVSDIRHDVVKTRGTVSELKSSVTNTEAMVSEIHRTMVDGTDMLTRTSAPGELPPPAPRACFGRAHLIDKVVGLAENLTPIALIGPGGIGKTSIALAVLHHENIKKRFGGDRRFIRCDQFPASSTHLLSRLSKVIGAGIDNPEDLASLRPSLSSREMLIVLDNAESILDPEGTDAEGIHAVVGELSQVANICLCITSRITAVPSDCETLDVPTLSIEAARDSFHRIYKNVTEQTELVDKILDQLDFHPLSITLFATVAHQNKWDMDRLAGEWERQRTRVLQPMNNKSFAATIELSLTSPLFQGLGPDARGLLEVIAFFPQGVDENNLDWLFPTISNQGNVIDRFYSLCLDWLFPTISNQANIIDNFCALSLTHRSGSVITMLAPLRDHFYPKDPLSSPLLCATKERYFTRMSVVIDLRRPDFGEMQWITSEDVNVEHLLDVFTAIDANSDSVWDSCINFIFHLRLHKPRLTVLGPRIEGLPDDHRSKPCCLWALADLLQSVGNFVEHERLSTHTLLSRERGGNGRDVLPLQSSAREQLCVYEEGIRDAEKELDTAEWLGDTIEQAECLIKLALLLRSNKQFDAAEDAASRAMDLFSEKGHQIGVYKSHRVLGLISQSKDDTKKAIYHLEATLGLASSFNWTEQLISVHLSLTLLFLGKGRFDDAQTHIERLKLHAMNDMYKLGLAMYVQAILRCKQHRPEEARVELLRAAEKFEKLGDTEYLRKCEGLLQWIEEEVNKRVIPEGSDDDEWITASEDGNSSG